MILKIKILRTWFSQNQQFLVTTYTNIPTTHNAYNYYK